MTIKTVIASQSIESRTLLENVLRSSEFETVFVGSSLKKLLVETSLNTPELIVISIDTADSHLLEQLQIIHQQYPLPIVIFAQDDSDDAIDKFIKAGVSAYVVDGLIEHRILAILKTAVVRFQQNQKLQKELHDLRTSLADRKVIDRAKGVIMAQRQCTEGEAYKLLRSNAMNKNIRLSALAQNIVDTASILITP